MSNHSDGYTIGYTYLGRKEIMTKQEHIHRRHQHTGVINGSVWSAHDRRVAGATALRISEGKSI